MDGIVNWQWSIAGATNVTSRKHKISGLATLSIFPPIDYLLCLMTNQEIIIEKLTKIAQLCKQQPSVLAAENKRTICETKNLLFHL